MEGTSAFSSADTEVINRPVDLDDQEARVGLQIRAEDDLPLEEFYEIEQTVKEVIKGDYKRIALQFPDGMLKDSVPIYRLLMKKLNYRSPDYQARQADETRTVFVLADTSYGSCCVDEVAAAHVNADVVVHYGHACLSPTSRLPVIYVFGRRNFDISNACAAITATRSTPPNELLIRQEVCYNHLIAELSNHLSLGWPNTRISYHVPERLQQPGRQTVNSDTLPDTEQNESTVIIYIGKESLALTNLLMIHGSQEVYSYNPTSGKCQLESWRTNKLLMRRYYSVQRAKDADVFGILIGTLGVASYLPLISHLRDLLRQKQKKVYTVSVGKLNPAKLGNFAEIECFVLVACPENSVIDAKEFLQPIVTPYELQVALNIVPTWTGRYLLDFEQVIQESLAHRSIETTGSDNEEEEDRDKPHFSLITGQYKYAKKYGRDTNHTSTHEQPIEGALVKRNQETAVGSVIGSAAGEFLQNRSWQGLEQRLGMDEPSILEQGRDGIAKGYSNHETN